MSADRTLVMKFGGTSVGDPNVIREVLSIVRQQRTEWPRLVVVTSAMAGVTNRLLESAGRAARGEDDSGSSLEHELGDRHLAALGALVPDLSQRAPAEESLRALLADYASLQRAIAVLGEATPRALDAIASIGERMSVQVLYAALSTSGIPAEVVDATRLIVTDDRFQNAHPDLAATRVATRKNLGPLLSRGVLPVVTGFLGATPSGVTTTLGRGGSDYSAALLGAALDAEEVWIWTDVDGVMTADPRLVPDARTIPVLSYQEVAELAYFGARVLHPKTIRPVIEAGIGLRVRNTFNPDHPGTRVVPNPSVVQDGSIKAVTAIQGQRLINIEGRGMIGIPGVAARAFAAVADTGTSVILISQASSEQSICFAIPSDATGQVVQALESAFAGELSRRDIDRIWATGETVIVTVVGAGMRHTPGVAGKVFSSLGDQRVNVMAIAQGSSEAAISMVMESADTERSVRALHQLITNGG